MAKVTSPPAAAVSCALPACDPSCGSTRSRSARARSRTSARTLWAVTGRALAQLHRDRPARAVPEDREPDLVAGAVRADLVGQVVLARQGRVVHTHDQVAANRDVRLSLE